VADRFDRRRCILRVGREGRRAERQRRQHAFIVLFICVLFLFAGCELLKLFGLGCFLNDADTKNTNRPPLKEMRLMDCPATLVFIFHAVNLREATLSEDEVEKFLANYFWANLQAMQAIKISSSKLKVPSARLTVAKFRVKSSAHENPDCRRRPDLLRSLAQAVARGRLRRGHRARMARKALTKLKILITTPSSST